MLGILLYWHQLRLVARSARTVPDTQNILFKAMYFCMRLLTILLFGFSLAAQVKPPASASFFTADASSPVAPNATTESSLRTVQPHHTVPPGRTLRSEEHTSELQSLRHL